MPCTRAVLRCCGCLGRCRLHDNLSCLCFLLQLRTSHAFAPAVVPAAGFVATWIADLIVTFTASPRLKAWDNAAKVGAARSMLMSTMHASNGYQAEDRYIVSAA